MESKDDLRDELEDLSPLLAKMKGKGEGFKVPANYFHHLPNEVLRRLEAEPPPPARRDWLGGLLGWAQAWFQPRYALALASVAVLLVAGIVFLRNGKDPNVPPALAAVSLQDIPEEEINAWLHENIEAAEPTILAEAEPPEKATKDAPQPKAKPQPKALPEAETEDIEQYLDEYLEDINIEDLEDIL